jgi:hypothetical protein
VFDTLFRRILTLRLAAPVDDVPFNADAGIHGAWEAPGQLMTPYRGRPRDVVDREPRCHRDGRPSWDRNRDHRLLQLQPT